MTGFKFFELLSSNSLIYILSLLISLFLFYGIMRATSSSWLNPLRFNVFTFSLGISVVLFLYFLGLIKFQTFIYIIISITIYWLTFLWIFKNKQRQITIKFVDEPQIAKYLFYSSYSLYLLLTLVSYKLLGIPIFNEDSRLATYTGSGFGYIARFSPILYTYSLFYIIHLFHQYKNIPRKISNIVLLIPLIIIGILSGSRASFLGIIFAFWGYRTFYFGAEPKVKDFKWLIMPFLIISIFTFSIQSSGDLKQAGFMFLERVVACGDLYWESLPNDAWRSIVVNRPFEFTFMGFLGPLRLLDPTHAEVPIGYQLTNIIYPSLAGKSTGPVALFPIFGLVCYGYVGGCIFSFFQAILVSSVFRITFLKSNSIIVSAMAYFAFNNAISLIGDISAGFGACLDSILSFLLISFFLITIALFYYSKEVIFNRKTYKTHETS